MHLTAWVELEITIQLLNGENAMKITKWDAAGAEDIGQAFGITTTGKKQVGRVLQQQRGSGKLHSSLRPYGI